MRGRNLVVAALLAGCGAALYAQPVQGIVEAVGFPAPTSTGCIARAGHWLPVRTRFTLQGTGLFTRELRLDGIDLDGDRVTFAHPQVTLSSEGGEKSRRVWCYATANNVNELPAHLVVVDEQGTTVDRLAVPPCDLITDDDLLILDISEPKVAALDLLRPGRVSGRDEDDGSGECYRKVVVAKSRAADLPDSWLGLEAVDVVVWDQPSAADLGRTRQINALVDWVRNGGQLVLGLGASWNTVLENPALAAILPMRGPGTLTEVTSLPTFQDRFSAEGKKRIRFDRPVAVGWGEIVPGAVRTLGDVGPGGVIHLITMRCLGSGRVVATAASLRDLTASTALDVPRFASALLELNRYSDEQLKAKRRATFGAAFLEPLYLCELLIEPVSFGTATAARAFIAFWFAAGYIAVATLGSWVWLTRRRRTHWSWVALAVCGAAAGFLSLGTVRALRGISGGVQSLCIVDMEAGERAARGPCWFGYRSPVREVTRLALPGEGNFLRPMTRPPRDPTYYVTAARCTAFPLKSRLENVLVRATLKQLEGYWHGELDGTIRGDLVVSRTDGRLTPASWILNELDADLEGAYLLFLDPRHDDGGVPRAANLTRLPALEGITAEPEKGPVPPARNIVALPLGRLPAGRRVDNLGSSLYQELDRKWREWAGRQQRRRRDMPDLPSLWTEQPNWRSGSSTSTAADRAVRAILLASTRNYDAALNQDDYNAAGVPVTSYGLPKLDITHWLLGGRAEGQAVLIGWTRQPGPAQLRVNDQPRNAYAGLTVYRVRIPIRYVGRPPAVQEEGPP